MSLLQQIKADQLQARKNKDVVTATLLTTLIGEASMIGKNDGNRESTDAEVIAVIKKFIKNAEDTIAVVNNPAATEGLQQERDILAAYLPRQMTKEQLMYIISTQIQAGTFAKDARLKGSAMKYLKSTLDGQYDGKVASEAIEEILKV